MHLIIPFYPASLVVQ